jgi:hypothetical protein
MTDTTLIIACIILLIPPMVYMYGRLLQQITDLQIEVERIFEPAMALLSEETKRKAKHNGMLENLTDPDKIQEDMERGADILEARQANRLHQPRPDAGPPAKVFRPKFVGKRASFWNPPRP